jgi:hypothetical protein
MNQYLLKKTITENKEVSYKHYYTQQHIPKRKKHAAAAVVLGGNGRNRGDKRTLGNDDVSES